MRSAITVSLVPEARGGPFVFWQGLVYACEAAQTLGFDGIELFPPSAAAVAGEEVAREIAARGLKLAAVGTGGGWVVRRLTLTHADAEVRREARGFIRDIVDAAGRLGAPAIVGSMQGRWEGPASRELAMEQLADALGELGQHAAQYSVPLLFEPLNRYETNLFNRIGDTAAWLRSAGVRNVRILADLFHMNIEEADSPAALRDAGQLVGHVHFADSNRRAIGFGQTNIPPIIAALREINYTGYLSAEILPLPEPVAAARQALQAFRAHVAKE